MAVVQGVCVSSDLNAGRAERLDPDREVQGETDERYHLQALAQTIVRNQSSAFPVDPQILRGLRREIRRRGRFWHDRYPRGLYLDKVRAISRMDFQDLVQTVHRALLNGRMVRQASSDGASLPYYDASVLFFRLALHGDDGGARYWISILRDGMVRSKRYRADYHRLFVSLAFCLICFLTEEVWRDRCPISREFLAGIIRKDIDLLLPEDERVAGELVSGRREAVDLWETD